MAGPEPALGAREPGVHGGRGMIAAVVTVRPPTALALLLTVAAVLLIGSGVSYTLLQARSAAGARVLPVDALYNLALDAGAAVAGDAAALTRFQQRQKALEDAAARDRAGGREAPEGPRRHIRRLERQRAPRRGRRARAAGGAERGARDRHGCTRHCGRRRAVRHPRRRRARVGAAAAPGRGTCAVDRGARRDAAHAPRG